MMIRRVASILITLLASGVVCAADIFPGAVGHAENAVGGRGGILIKVTTLGDSTATKYCQPNDGSSTSGVNNDGNADGGTLANNWEDAETCTTDNDCENVGAGGVGQCIEGQLGSFRRAVRTQRDRYVSQIASGDLVMSGNMTLDDASPAVNDNMTFFGQAAFGDGVRVSSGAILLSPVSQWVLRYLEINRASGPDGPDYMQGTDCHTSSTFFVRGDTQADTVWAENIMLDHVTFGGSGDESIGMYGGTRNVTFQNSFAGNAAYVVGMCCPEQSAGVSDCWLDDGDGTPPTGPDDQIHAESCKTNSDCGAGDACDLTFTACRGHAALVGGNSGTPTATMRNAYNHTYYQSAFGQSHIRSPKISGMFETTTETCTGGTCDGGFRLSEACTSADQCPDIATGGSIDLINIFTGAPGAGPSKLLGMILGSNEQFSMINLESSVADRGGESGQGRSRLIQIIAADDYYYINDFVGVWESQADDGTICDRIPNNRRDCVTNAVCANDCDPGGVTKCECDVTPACPVSAPCDVWTTNDSAGTPFVSTAPGTVVSSRIGGATYTGVADTEISAVANVRADVVGANRTTGDDFPFESELLEASLDELRDGLGSQYHCAWACPSSTNFDPLQPDENSNRCPPECTTSGSPSGVPAGTGSWTGDSGTVGWWQDDRWDGLCESPQTTKDCRCNNGTILDGATCASADCTNNCQIGVVTTSAGAYVAGLGGYYLDTDHDGMDDAWEIVNNPLGDLSWTTTSTDCDGWSDGINTTNFDHLECIEVFMAERVGELTAPAASSTTGDTGVSGSGVSRK